MLDWVLLAIGVPFAIGTIASFVGMLRFRRWSRPLAVMTTVVGVLLLPLVSPTVEPGVSTALNYAASVLYGALLALAHCPPTAAWF